MIQSGAATPPHPNFEAPHDCRSKDISRQKLNVILGASRAILRQTNIKMKRLLALKSKLILCLVLIWTGIFWSISTNAADTNTLRVVVIPSKTEVQVKETFKVALRVENPTATNQMVRVWSCSWDEEWKTSNTNISWVSWACTINNDYDLTIPPGGAYTNELEMLIPQQISNQTLTFQMGFTPIGSEKAYWSDKVKLNIISADK